ncbi:MAG: hypothetical protein CK425_03550 [Parachlamydia sp.]|nr:MAG: hypothetical protein CK425_03550 [Parachlamydia sp.]
MKKYEKKQLALRGILSAFITVHAALVGDEKGATDIQKYGVSAAVSERGNMGYHLMTEDELMLELNDEGVALYNSLDKEGKELARYVASQRCMASNACKGLNACQNTEHACMGKGKCKGLGKCSIADKNLAVKLVAKKMAEKRQKAAGGTTDAPVPQGTNQAPASKGTAQ